LRDGARRYGEAGAVSAPRTARTTDRLLLAVAAALGIASIAALLLPLTVILTPFLGNITGLFKVGITTDETGLRFIGLAAMLGGAGLVGSIWLMTSVRRRP
jgi:hypothetical protein